MPGPYEPSRPSCQCRRRLGDHGRSCCTSPASGRKSNVDRTSPLRQDIVSTSCSTTATGQREHRSGRHRLDVEDVGLEVAARRRGDAQAADRVAAVVREALIDALGADDEPAGGRLVTVGVRGDELVRTGLEDIAVVADALPETRGGAGDQVGRRDPLPVALPSASDDDRAVERHDRAQRGDVARAGDIVAGVDEQLVDLQPHGIRRRQRRRDRRHRRHELGDRRTGGNGRRRAARCGGDRGRRGRAPLSARRRRAVVGGAVGGAVGGGVGDGVAGAVGATVSSVAVVGTGPPPGIDDTVSRCRRGSAPRPARPSAPRHRRRHPGHQTDDADQEEDADHDERAAGRAVELSPTSS